jgi:hypothetical protein
LLRELVVLDGPAGGLSSRDAAFLTNFIIKRRELGDPALSVLAPEVVEPMRLPGATCLGPGELHHWSYEPSEPALDGSRGVFVRYRDGIRVLMVIDRDLRVIDGLWIDPLFSGRCDYGWFKEFLQTATAHGRRPEVRAAPGAAHDAGRPGRLMTANGQSGGGRSPADAFAAVMRPAAPLPLISSRVVANDTVVEFIDACDNALCWAWMRSVSSCRASTSNSPARCSRPICCCWSTRA